MKTGSKIIWNPEDLDEMEFLTIISSGALPKGTIIKLNRLFFERSSKRNIAIIQGLGYPVYIDAKILEVANDALKIAEIYLTYRPYMLSMMACACSTGIAQSDNPNEKDCLKRFTELCSQYDVRPCGVAVLASKTPALVEAEYCTRTNVEQVLWYANKLHECGFNNVDCSPLEAREIIKHNGLAEMTLNVSGARMPRADKRVVTPANVLNLGADRVRIVIGSNLTDGSGNLVERVKENYKKIRDYCIENAHIDITDGSKCT